MKRRILVVIAMALSALFLSSQSLHAQAAQQGAQKFEQLSKQLNLTPSQKLQLIPILKAEAPKLEAIKANTSLTRLQKMEQLKAVHNETAPQVKAILTPEQYQNLQEIRRQEINQAIRQRQNQ